MAIYAGLHAYIGDLQYLIWTEMLHAVGTQTCFDHYTASPLCVHMKHLKPAS